MDRGVSGLHDNAPKEDNNARVTIAGTDQVRQNFRSQTTTTTSIGLSKSMPPNEQGRPARGTTSTPTAACLAAHAARGIAVEAPQSRNRHSGVHAQPTTAPHTVVHPTTPPSRYHHGSLPHRPHEPRQGTTSPCSRSRSPASTHASRRSSHTKPATPPQSHGRLCLARRARPTTISRSRRQAHDRCNHTTPQCVIHERDAAAL
jgi:hypothetical protein